MAGSRKFAELSMDGEVLPVKVMEALTKDGLRRLAEDVGIDEGDIIFVAPDGTDGGGALLKISRICGVRAVIAGCCCACRKRSQMLPAFREADLPLLSDKEAGVQVRGKQGLCRKGDA